MAGKIETLEDVKQWIAGTDARSQAFWDAQKGWNHDMERRTDGIQRRLSSLELRVMWLAGFAAAAGGVLGTVLPKVFGG